MCFFKIIFKVDKKELFRDFVLWIKLYIIFVIFDIVDIIINFFFESLLVIILVIFMIWLEFLM